MNAGTDRPILTDKKTCSKRRLYAGFIAIATDVTLITLLWMFLVAIFLLTLPIAAYKNEIVSYYSKAPLHVGKDFKMPLLKDTPYVHRISYRTDRHSAEPYKDAEIYFY